ncbi:aromatic ring-hydroxylating oxygenase subunit alpha [Legionella brunensis]|nr:aromatic ring-hydroxylating dioxygenase subunit alpha [Legionella brunensis]
MFLTQQKIFKNFWYPVIPLSHLKNGPKSFTLLGEPLVLWLDEKGAPCAAQDRCAHRSAQLSRGWVCDGNIVCPYHAWTYNKLGKCVQTFQGGHASNTYQIIIYKAQEKYGYVWVCLGVPIRNIPQFSEAESPKYRLIECFYETWNTMSLRVVENELDMAHFAVVHRGTFGNPYMPLPLTMEIIDIDNYSIRVRAEISVSVPEQQQKNTHVLLKTPEEKSSRMMDIIWLMPFTIKLSITYPSGLNHVIINHPTPIDDNHIQVVQFCFRNDSEQETPSAELIKFERKILDEDRFILESTDCNYPLFGEYNEAHMPSDKAIMIVRKKLRSLIENYNNENL